MEYEGHVVVFITVETDEESQSIAQELLDRRKAACVNIISGIKSLFRWKGRLDSAQESLLIVKTRKSLLCEVVKIVKEFHSYDVPEIIALPLIGGNEDYLEWIDTETG